MFASASFYGILLWKYNLDRLGIDTYRHRIEPFIAYHNIGIAGLIFFKLWVPETRNMPATEPAASIPGLVPAVWHIRLPAGYLVLHYQFVGITPQPPFSRLG